MKTFLPTVLLVLFGLTSQASTLSVESIGADCRETFIYENMDLSYALKIENDLLQGTWTNGEVMSESAVYRFQDYGMLEIIQKDASGDPRYESYMWRIEEYNNQAFLVLTSSDFKHEQLYQTMPTCQGMVLVDPVSVNQINLTYNADLAEAKLEKINQRLTGSWENASYPFDLTNTFEDCGTFEPINGAYLQYQFNVDGTFSKSFGSHLAQLEEKGYYELFGAGQFVLFHIEEANGNYRQHVAQIKHLEYGELVLEESLESDDFAQFFCSDLKSISYVQ